MNLRINTPNIGIGLLALLLSAGLIKTVMSAWQAGDPLANSNCASCHVAKDGGRIAAESRMLLAGQEQLCTTCHKDALGEPSQRHTSGYANTGGLSARLERRFDLQQLSLYS